MSRISIPNVGDFDREVLFSMPSAGEVVQYHRVSDAVDPVSPAGVSRKSAIAFVSGVFGGLVCGISMAICLL